MDAKTRLAESTVLIVEDNIQLATLYTIMLAHPDLHITQAFTCEQAIESIAALRPQVVILDMTLPDGSGQQVIDFVRDNNYIHTDLIVITNNAQNIDSTNFRGHFHTVRKPVSTQTLSDIIYTLMQ